MLSLIHTPASDILAALSHSRFRARFRLSAELQDYTRQKAEVLPGHARELLSERLGPARLRDNDGRQTPMKGHPVFVAQHATALCCRGCMAKWYGIDPDRALTEEELAAAVRLILLWIARHLEDEANASDQKARRRTVPSAGGKGHEQLTLF
ncbi:MAG: DUF4186 family protein [Duodenibacillus sp.]